MPRTRRALRGGYCYHVINRGNERREVFHQPSDYAAFLARMAEAECHQKMRLLAYCLMPNHFHLVLWPVGDRDISRWMHWLTTTQANHYRRRYGGIGHLWQGRFKPFPIQHDDHSADGDSLRGTKSSGAEPCRQRRGLGLVVLGLSPDRCMDAGLVPRSGASRCQLARTRESTVDGSRTDRRATVGEARYTVWIEPLDRNHRQNPRARIHATPARTTGTQQPITRATSDDNQPGGSPKARRLPAKFAMSPFPHTCDHPANAMKAAWRRKET